ncbi:MAG: hypothetical protein ACFFCW_45395 [Candidatus Hodarchaeota archaeon]
MEQYIVCKDCGKKINKSLSHCPECGAEYIPQSIKTRQKRLRGTVIAIVAIFLLLFIVFPEVRLLVLGSVWIFTVMVFLFVGLVVLFVIFGSGPPGHQ